jgi:hypothetical protein
MYRTILCAAAAGVVIFSLPAKADETLKFRVVQHSASFQTQQVGDAVLGLFRLVGIAFFPDDSTGTTVLIGVFDDSSGGGTDHGYYTIKFADGSELSLKYTGGYKFNNPKITLNGTTIVIGGKGRYAGATGSGSYEGGQNQPGPEGIGYIDNVINIKK